MNYTTISVKEDTKGELKKLKSKFNTKSMDELLKILISQAKEQYIDEFSRDFNERLEDKGLSLDDILQAGERIRNELIDKKE
jgi:predicted CopG family antitoxin